MNIQLFQTKKQKGEKISMVTCYDYPSAKLVGKTQIDTVLVGDSLAMTVHGYPSTVHATMEMMVMHTEAVARGLGSKFLISDMPFTSNRLGLEHTVNCAAQLIRAGAHAVKIEGADDFTCRQITHLVETGIPVVGHIGLQPQSVLAYGGYKVQGKSEQQAKELIAQALRLQAVGCFALVLECIPSSLAKEITSQLSIATIGIGAGVQTDGQVLVWHDLLGLQNEILPKFVKRFEQLDEKITAALNGYHQEVQLGDFPGSEHGFK